MITFEAIDAAFGDCILIRYHSEEMNTERLLLIDGGPSKAGLKGKANYSPYADRLVPRLMQIKAERDKRPKKNESRSGDGKAILDLVVCTHIDADHIDGIQQLYACLSGDGDCATGGTAINAPRLWFNSFSKLMEGVPDIDKATKDAVIASVGDGDQLTVFAQNAGAEVNTGRDGLLVAAGQVEEDLFEPVKVTITNPGKKQLEKLQEIWRDESRIEAEMHATRAQLAGGGGRVGGDSSTANLSSIVMLLEGFGRRILLTGDQRGDHIFESLQTLKRDGRTLLDAQGKLHLDIMKVPHHGSSANNQEIFHENVTADIYVFCASGKNSNPDGPVLELIASQAKDRKFTMAFTQREFTYDKPTEIGGAAVKTLSEAIGALRKVPGAENITFEHIPVGALSWSRTLAAKP